MFHWLAIFNLLTVMMGYVPARARTLGGKAQHAYFMSGSYVGLAAAMAAEMLTRWTTLPFLVGVVSLSVIFVGVLVMRRYIPRHL